MDSTVDVIKTRYLSDQLNRYSSVTDCIRQTYQADGITIFLRVRLNS